MAIGFTYIFRVTRVFHLAHGAIFVSGAFSFWWGLSLTANWLLSGILALGICALLIYLIEKVVYLPLSKKQTNQSISLIASMGLYAVVINILALVFGNENKMLSGFATNSYNFGNLILTNIQIYQVAASAMIIVAYGLLQKFSRTGLVLQAISDNESIGQVIGINTDRERLKVFIIGSIFACIAAILRMMDVGMDVHTGMGITLTAAVVAILVSRLSISLILVFTIALSLLQNVTEWFLNAQWRDGITFVILLLVILFRTEGVISYNLRKDRA
ncbi:MAG: branched-chain amino acid ABC transporter permease [Chloracidobacterium sp.]|nr:branched-chain amino acid ABC transporter permease [Chloracidobacterium sp.]